MHARSLLAVCWRQWWTERALARRGVRFRTTDPRAVETAYAAMSDREFEAINGRQAWANGRTIPRALAGRLPARPLLAIDLGCGTGPSTRVLAACLPVGSRVIGYELAEPLARVAGTRTYPGADGRPADVSFVCQGVTELLKDPRGEPLAGGGVDVANASGVVGHHLTGSTVGPLVAELARVIAAGGYALLDVGPTLSDGGLSCAMGPAGFERIARYRSWWLDPTGQVLYRKR